MRIAQDKIAQIRDAILIEEVIGSYITLKKAGKNYKGKCPFHPDKNPSFFVDPQKGLYHCFGCGKSGSVFTFISEYNNLSFYEAVKLLGEKTGIKIEFTEDKNENLYKVNELSAKLYHSTLFSERGTPGQKWLSKRGINETTIKNFMLGYAPAESVLAKSAKLWGISSQELYNVGLLRDGKDNFHNKVIFPIRNRGGKVVGFGTRVLDNSEPKYVNSPESPVFKKGNLLYGLYEAGNNIREKAILVEGYMDLLSLHQAGIKNVLATLGTSITLNQAKLLRLYSRSVISMYDGDIAGVKATDRAIDVLLEVSLDVEIYPLPEEDDPDSFIMKNKSMDFNTLRNFVDFKYKECKNVAQKTDLIKSYRETLNKIPDDLKRELWTVEVAKKLDIKKELLFARAPLPVAKKTPTYIDLRTVEIELLGLISSRFSIARDCILQSEFAVTTEELKPLFELALNGARADEIIDHIKDAQLRDSFSKSIFEDMDDDGIKQMVNDRIRYINRAKIQKQRQELHKKVKDGATEKILIDIQKVEKEYQALR